MRGLVAGLALLALAGCARDRVREREVVVAEQGAEPALIAMLSDGSAPVERALELLASGQTEDARVLLEAAARVSTDRPDVPHYNLGLLAEQAGDEREARTRFLRAWSLRRGESRYREAALRAGATLPE